MSSGITGFLLAAEIRGFEGTKYLRRVCGRSIYFRPSVKFILQPTSPFVVVFADSVRSTSDLLTFPAMSIRRNSCCDSPEAPLHGSVVIGSCADVFQLCAGLPF
ncbi:hypothetical protein E5676_scaffold2612G00350 [Cucumis melo var. makuwa]|uniref:Uncharacterized protein n=1 Tax=Cucumis melo var. makuwa TaxID=1194695 RepID=A0A5A7T7E9_CUCMM|nr:hypothetical protein E6C27_scaffold1170G00460 [Cucumis melo var. makuwa]TYJ96022.1 hypothetical protein E5676_scaffold2612G00350 [Cucumis melo var. makuwa]